MKHIYMYIYLSLSKTESYQILKSSFEMLYIDLFFYLPH